MDINRRVSEIRKLGLSPKTVCNVVGELRAFLRFHKRSLSSLPDFPQVKFQVPKIRYLNPTNQDPIFKFIPQEALPIFAMLRFYGCRENEASGLLRENVFLDAPKPYVVIATALGKWGQVKPNTKTMKARVLPISEKLLWIFENNSDGRFVFTRNGRPYRYQMLNTAWNKDNQMANKEYETPIINQRNTTRHSFACQKLDGGFRYLK